MLNKEINVIAVKSKFRWINFVNEWLNYDYSKYNSVTFNLSKCVFFDCGSLVLLACLIEKINDSGIQSIKFEGGSPQLNNHLENIKFKRYWEPTFDRTKYTAANNSSTLCLWKISPTMIESYSQQAQHFYSNSSLRIYDFQPLSSALVELFNNIFDHSQSDVSGYVLTQYYPSIERLTFAVCDFGRGIPTTLNEYLKSISQPTLTSSDALRESLKPKISAKSSPRNAGMGLATVFDLSEYSDGELIIYSADGFLKKKSNSTFLLTNQNEYFNGTFVQVSFDVNMLELVNEDETVNIF